MSRLIDTIVIHHSVTPRDLELEKSVSSFNNNHKQRLHPEKNHMGLHIAYHFVISGSGAVEQTRAIDEVGYHASNLSVNNTSIGICLTGNFDKEEPTPMQYESLRKLIEGLRRDLGKLDINGHNEYSKKSCPGKNFDFSQLDKELMPYYEKLRRGNYSTLPRHKRFFKDPEAFIERLEGLTVDQKLSEMTFLIAILAEKTGTTFEKMCGK